MFRRLFNNIFVRNKEVFGVLVSILITMSLSLVLISHIENRSIKLSGSLLSQQLYYPVLIGNETILQEVIEKSGVLKEIEFIKITDEGNDVIYESGDFSSFGETYQFNISDVHSEDSEVGFLVIKTNRIFVVKAISGFLALIFFVVQWMFLKKYLTKKRSEQEVIDDRVIELLRKYSEYQYSSEEVEIISNRKLSDALRKLSESLSSLEKENTEKKKYIATMSHEIRNPLNAIVAMIDLARKNIDDPKLLSECINDASEASEMLISVINDVIDIAKIESGSLDINVKPFSIQYLVQSVVSIAEKFTPVELKLDVSKCHPFVVGDETRIKQILVNLLSNSAKHTTEGYIAISVESMIVNTDKYALLFKVKDTGTGIEQDEIEKIFEPFVSDGKGAGLGLYISKTYVEAMNGKIEIDSKIGFGTETIVSIPVEIITKQAYCRSFGKEYENNERESLIGVRVLVVEDNPINSKALVHLVRSWKMECDCDQDGSQALSRDLSLFDLILMDLNLPGMSGFELAEKIRARGVSVPIIAVTGNVLIKDKNEAKALGFKGFIGKPYNPEYLKRECIRVLGGYESKDDGSVFKNYPGLAILEAKGKFELDDNTLLNDLRYFIDRYRNVHLEIRKLVEEGEISKVNSIAHDLKTDSSNIGANEVAAIALLLEEEEIAINEASILAEMMKEKIDTVINSAVLVLESDSILDAV